MLLEKKACWVRDLCKHVGINTMKQHLGSTLIELCIVLSLMTILCTLVLVGWMPWYRQQASNLDHRQLLQALRYAMQSAIIEGEDIGLCYSDEKHQCRATPSTTLLVFIDSEHHGRITQRQQRLRQWVIADHAQLFFRSYPNYRHYLLFTASHVPRHDNATLWYCDASHHTQWAVTLSQSGRMITHYPTADGTVRDHAGNILGCDTIASS